jgi:hypothetical protein
MARPWSGRRNATVISLVASKPRIPTSRHPTDSMCSRMCMQTNSGDFSTHYPRLFSCATISMFARILLGVRTIRELRSNGQFQSVKMALCCERRPLGCSPLSHDPTAPLCHS